MSGPPLPPPPPEGMPPTPPPSWSAPPSPREPFRWGQFFGGVGLALLGLLAGFFGFTLLTSVASLGGAALLLVPVAFVAVLVVGIVLTTRPERRAMGIGMLVGLAASVVILGGMCVALIAGFGAPSG